MKRNTESTTPVTMTQKVSCHESSRSANYRLLHVSVHCCLVLYGLFKKLAFVPVASTTTAMHIDCVVVASNAK